MKNFIVVLFFVPLFASAQKTHTVQPKETLYSLARKYNVHPRELAAYNNIPVETSLTVGQVIKIPAKTTMAPLADKAPEKKEEVKKEPEKTVKPEQVAKKEATVKKEGSPIYHKVAKKETLYHISKLYEGVTIDDIKKWNKLTSDGVSEGTNLIVGYTKAAEKKTSEPVLPKKEEDKSVVKETPKPAEQEKKEIIKPVEQEKKEEQTVSKTTNGTGTFKTVFEKQTSAKNNLSEVRGMAGVFKSTSGWEDGKYYCLTNAAPAGTIVKVTNTATQRSVYAKVLDLMPDMKQNAGLVMRISNAAASELGGGMENFESTINF